MVNGFESTDKRPPLDGYAPVTYAYDLLDSEEKKAVTDELKRLTRMGAAPLLYWYDTRESVRPVKVGIDKWRKRPSIWGEVWREI